MTLRILFWLALGSALFNAWIVTRAVTIPSGLGWLTYGNLVCVGVCAYYAGWASGRA